LGAIAALFVLPLAATAWAVPAPAPTLEQVQQKMAGLAVPFEANQGQFAPEVAFAARTFAGTLFITRDGKIVHALAGKPQQKEEAKQGKEAQQNNEVTPVDHTPSDRTGMDRTPRGPGWSLVESLRGAGELTPTGSQPSATRVSRFAGGAVPNQTSSIATYDRIGLGEAWPGVSVELAARGNNVEKLFTVAPGTSPKKIRMRVAGAKRLRLGDDGSLIAATGNGDVAFTPPVGFQVIAGQQSTVSVRYVLLADNSYRFEITGAYDHSQPLVIDPLLQSSYLGGSADDRVTALTFAVGGDVLIAGRTTSVNFPGTAGGAQPPSGGGSDVFVARLSNNLTTLVQATYLGGSGTDQATALAIDSGGSVLVAGSTDSTNFPGTAGAAQVANGGGTFDAFVARLSSDLATLVRATYLGGSDFDQAYSLILDASGNVFVAGESSSINFPGTIGGAQPANGSTSGFGISDAFVARLSDNLTNLVQATYLGGRSADRVDALALDAGGDLLVAGGTISNDLPATAGNAQPALGGQFDAFVARLSSNLATLMQATYLGGIATEGANALKLDASGNVLVAGSTNSSNFPGTSGGAQPAYGGGFNDGFVARLSSNLTTLMQATYLGGTGGTSDDRVDAMAIDASGNVLVAGLTTSTIFPGTAGGAQPAYGGGSSDAFLARLTSNLTMLTQATYLGGSGFDRPNALALGAGGTLFVAGTTASANFPSSTGGAQAGNGGGNDAFLAKLTLNLQASNDSIFGNGFE